MLRRPYRTLSTIYTQSGPRRARLGRKPARHPAYALEPSPKDDIQVREAAFFGWPPEPDGSCFVREAAYQLLLGRAIPL
jgi:hypothetical protein